MATIKTKNRRRKLRQHQQQKNQILGRILGEKDKRKLTLRPKRRKENWPSFVLSVARLTSNRDLE
jgi:Tat protein secretion system quality control protein TatD with DNase activity